CSALVLGHSLARVACPDNARRNRKLVDIVAAVALAEHPIAIKPQSGCLSSREHRDHHGRMSRDAAIARATAYFDGGAFKSDLARRVAIPTESQTPERAGELARYVESEMRPALEVLGMRCEVMRQPKWRGPFILGERIEGEGLPTVLGYGHGDVIRGLDAGWRQGLSPWWKLKGATTAAALPTTRASTASILARSPRCWKRAAGSASI